MNLNINKRLRYFNTEAEYLAYVEAQRAAAEAGTLELMETTVCCIKHNDDTTPDEYHPSTEAGYTDVVFNYNEDDDIRYVPFINPMWTSRLCTVYPIKDTEGTVIGYKPVLYQDTSLPDIIDGQQFTLLDDGFFRHANNFPEFSISNIENIKTNDVYHTKQPSYNVPEHWTSLKTVDVWYGSPYAGMRDYEDFLIFGNNNILTAPNLEYFKYYYVSNARKLPNSENCTIISSKLKACQYWFLNAGGVLNLSSYIPRTDSLQVLIGPLEAQTFNFNCVYPSLWISALTIRPEQNSESENTSAIVTGNDGSAYIENITLNNLNLSKCTISGILPIPEDFTISSDLPSWAIYSQPFNYSTVALNSCTLEQNSSGNLLEYISWNGNSMSLNLIEGGHSPKSTYIRNCIFTNINITESQNHNLSRFLYINPLNAGSVCTINIDSSVPPSAAGYYYNPSIEKPSDISSPINFSIIEINLPTTVDNNICKYSFHDISAPADKLILNYTGKLYAYDYGEYYTLSYNYSVDNKYLLYHKTSSSKANIVSPKVFRQFVPYTTGISCNVNTAIDELSCILEKSEDTFDDGDGRYATIVSFELTLVTGGSVNAYNITVVPDTKEFSCKLTCIDKTASLLNELKKALLVYDNTFFSRTFTAGITSTINIHRNFYSQLDTQSMSIVNKFTTINIYEDEVS